MTSNTTIPNDKSSVISNFTINNEIHTNIESAGILITEDKLRLCLIDHNEKIKVKLDWVAPAGIFVTLITTLIATDFKKFILGADTWKAMYIVVTCGVGIWLISTAIKAYKQKDDSIEDVIKKIKNSNS